MAIEFPCPNCQRFLRVDDAAAGAQVRCPECQHISAAPSPLAGPLNVDASPSSPAAPDTIAPSPNPYMADEPNPYASPSIRGGVGEDPLVSERMARAKVAPPAIGLIVVACAGLLLCILNVVNAFVIQRLGGQLPRGAPADAVEQTVALIIGGGFGFLINTFILFGALKMRQLKHYGLAMAASILALVPCGTCCLLAAPIGIWSIVVLSDSSVKRHFG